MFVKTACIAFLIFISKYLHLIKRLLQGKYGNILSIYQLLSRQTAITAPPLFDMAYLHMDRGGFQPCVIHRINAHEGGISAYLGIINRFCSQMQILIIIYTVYTLSSSAHSSRIQKRHIMTFKALFLISTPGEPKKVYNP